MGSGDVSERIARRTTGRCLRLGLQRPRCKGWRGLWLSPILRGKQGYVSMSSQTGIFVEVFGPDEPMVILIIGV